MTKEITLNKFQPREYQLPLLDAIENHGIYYRLGLRKFISIWPRRAGKDVCAFNIMLRAALRQVGAYYYMLPTYSAARNIIWDCILINGQRMLDFIPSELIKSKNEQRMQIKLMNGSIIQMCGSDSYNTSLVGTNPRGIIFSEFSQADEDAYKYARPILAANGGWVLFVSTPRGKNHFYNFYKIAQDNPETWFLSKLTLDDTRHISLEEIQKDRDDGLISEDLIQQEYYTSFDLGIEGAYYTKYLDKMRLNGQIGDVPWDQAHKVYVAMDIGYSDATSIVFFQVIGQRICIIDCYENSKMGLEHYIDLIERKPYNYHRFYAPHDMRVHEFGTGMTRLEKAAQLGINFKITPMTSLEDGIEAVRTVLPRCWIDERHCKKVIDALENYRQEYDSVNGVYKRKPIHDRFSHMADALRYMAVNIKTAKIGTTPEELDRRYREARFGMPSNLPIALRDDVPPIYGAY